MTLHGCLQRLIGYDPARVTALPGRMRDLLLRAELGTKWMSSAVEAFDDEPV